MKIEELFEKIVKPQFMALKIGDRVNIDIGGALKDKKRSEFNIQLDAESIFISLYDRGYIGDDCVKKYSFKTKELSEDSKYQDIK